MSADHDHLADAGSARDWFAVAVGLDQENRELRRMLTALIFWIAERTELLEFARAAIDKRFSEGS